MIEFLGALLILIVLIPIIEWALEYEYQRQEEKKERKQR